MFFLCCHHCRCETNIIKKLSLKSSSWVYVTYLWIKADFYSDSEIAVTGTCAGDQKVLICTRQRPVGREERINFTLERRSKRHLRICRGISLFPLLISQGSIKKKIYLLEWLWAVCVCDKAQHIPPKKQQRPNWNQSFSFHHFLGQICYFEESPSSMSAISHNWIDRVWFMSAFNWCFHSASKLIFGVWCVHGVLK